MQTIRIGLLTGLFTHFLAGAAIAQFTPSPFEVGLNLGSLIYQGDLSKSELGYTESIRPALGLQGAKTMNDHFSLRTAFMLGNIHAYDSTYSSPAWRKYRDLKFHSPVFELSAVAEYYLLGDAEGARPGRLSPYLL